jgi:hypothetical protein
LVFGADVGQEGGGGFVGAVFAAGEFGFGGDQLAAEGFGQDRLRDLLNASCRCLDAGFDLVGEREQGLDAADDFLLFVNGGDSNRRHPQVIET